MDVVTPPLFLLRTFGTFDLVALDGDGNVTDTVLGAGKPLALLAYCVSARDREYSRDLLASLLWSDAEPERARHNVRQALWRLRRLVGDVIRTNDDRVGGVTTAIASDRERFQEAIRVCDLPRMLESYRGSFLTDVSFPGADEFDDWALSERHYFEDLVVHNTDQLLRAVALQSKPAQTRTLAKQFLSACPNSMEAHRIVAEVQLAANDAPAAHETTNHLEALLRANECRPSAAMNAIIARVRESHSLISVPQNIPLALDLIGRDREFALALAAWQKAKEGHGQQLLIIGLAGIGKSRLLSALAQRYTSKRTRCINVRANFGERDLPFAFAASIARALAQLPGAAGISSESARELVALDPGLASTFHATPAAQDGESLRRRALAVLDLVTAIAEQEPLALLIDDVHWMDVASRQLLSVVFGRVSDASLLVVATTRTGISGLFDDRSALVLQLAPLSHADLVDAIASTGSWPDTEACDDLIARLAESSDGIPLQLVERLSLLEERGLLERVNNCWSSRDWSNAIAAVNVVSPIDQRLDQCSADELIAVRFLASAITPLSTHTLRLAMSLPESNGDSSIAVLDALAAKGLIKRDGSRWTMSHDLIAERAVFRMTAAEFQAVHRKLGCVLREREDSDQLAMAVRHFLIAHDDTKASEAFRRVVSGHRARGDQRRVGDLLTAIAGEGVTSERLKGVAQAVRPWHRVRWPHPAVTTVIASGVVALSALIIWQISQRPSLSFAQAPLAIDDVPVISPDARQLFPAAVVGFAQQHSATARSATSTVVRVRSLTPDVQILTADSSVMRNGRASFGALRFRSERRAVWFRFEAAGYKPLDFRMEDARDRDDHANTVQLSARIIRAVMNGTTLATETPVVSVARGSIMNGVVQIEYNTPWRSASVWLSMTPTWGDPALIGREITPVATPVREEVVDVAVTMNAPERAGHYWLLFVISGEPSGGFALSQTNWTLEKAVWHDGNDIATLSDSILRAGIRAGSMLTRRAYLPTHSGDRCDANSNRLGGLVFRYCLGELAITGIEVVVE